MNVRSMKKLNFIVAIIYTVFYGWLFLEGFMDDDNGLLIGSIILSGPLVVNWITYVKLNKQDEKK